MHRLTATFYKRPLKIARKLQATVLAVFFNVARYAIPVARDANRVARYAISVSREDGSLHLGGTVCPRLIRLVLFISPEICHEYFAPHSSVFTLLVEVAFLNHSHIF